LLHHRFITFAEHKVVITIPLFTEEQIQAAKSIDLLVYLQTYEPDSIRRSGVNEYCLKKHDSLKMSNGKWFWHSQGFGGHSAYDYFTKVQRMRFTEAIQMLLETRGYSPIVNYRYKSPTPLRQESLILPEANGNNDIVYAYLQGRGLDRSVIKQCIESGSLYEAAKTHHCVFVGFDNGKPKFATIRATKTDIKQDIKNSDKRYGFAMLSSNAYCSTLVAMESPVDILSHISIFDRGGHKLDAHRLSLGGISSLALFNFLERHGTVRHLYLSLDNDKAGNEATDRIVKEMLNDKRYSHIRITKAPPPLGRGKDFNDTLLAIRQAQVNRSEVCRSCEAVF
jgi:hypothetical protein